MLNKKDYNVHFKVAVLLSVNIVTTIQFNTVVVFLSFVVDEQFSFKYSPGKLRGNQYKTMMTKEELEEEQR